MVPTLLAAILQVQGSLELLGAVKDSLQERADRMLEVRGALKAPPKQSVPRRLR